MTTIASNQPSKADRLDLEPAELLTYQQAARFLNIPQGTLRALVHHGRVPYIRLAARTVRFRTQTLVDWLDAKERGSAEV